MVSKTGFPKLTPEEAVADIADGSTLAFSGYANAGGAKAIPRALAAKARSLHIRGENFGVQVLSGASSGDDVDEALAQARAITWRAPYQNAPTLRKQINRQEVEYVDMYPSHVAYTVSSGFFGKIDYAIVEATEITLDGKVYLTTSIGASATYLQHAEKVLIEINRFHSGRLRELADILLLPAPPHRNPIPMRDSLTRLGWSYAVVDPGNVVGIVENDEPDYIDPCGGPDGLSRRIAEHITAFLFDEMRAGQIPEHFLPMQAGAGPVVNGVLSALGENPYIPPFMLYSLVIEDAAVELMEHGKITGASGTSLAVSPDVLKRIYTNMNFFFPRMVLRPQEIANHPEIIRRLGVIALNSAVEIDIYGNVNSSHSFGTDIINGVGGSGEFTRNSYLPIILCPSIQDGGKISSIVPMTPHVDSNEHSVKIVVTEQGLADLRGLGPMQRAKAIIENCAHPMYRDYLSGYVEKSRVGHIRHDLEQCYALHRNLLEYGTMLPELNV